MSGLLFLLGQWAEVEMMFFAPECIGQCNLPKGSECSLTLWSSISVSSYSSCAVGEPQGGALESSHWKGYLQLIVCKCCKNCSELTRALGR